MSKALKCLKKIVSGRKDALFMDRRANRETKVTIVFIGILLVFCAQILVFRFAINPLITQDWFVHQCLSVVPYLDRMEIREMYAQGAISNEKPPLYFLAGAAIYKLAGSRPLAIYWLNAILCALTLFFTYKIGNAFFKDRKTGMFSALFLALFPIFVMQSREANMELMLSAVVCAGMWILARQYPFL